MQHNSLNVVLFILADQQHGRGEDIPVEAEDEEEEDAEAAEERSHAAEEEQYLQEETSVLLCVLWWWFFPPPFLLPCHGNFLTSSCWLMYLFVWLVGVFFFGGGGGGELLLCFLWGFAGGFFRIASFVPSAFC